MKRFAAAAAVAYVAAVAPSAQPPSTAPVTIDFLVTTDKGEPVTDLRPADIVLKVGGRERRVTALDLVSHRHSEATPAPTASSRLPPPYATSGAAQSGPVRHVMIVLDESAIPFGAEPPVKDGVAKLLATVSPRDRVGFVSLMTGGAQVAYSTERQPIAAAVDALVGGRGVPDACHTRVILETLRSALASTPPGLSSTIFFISAGVTPGGLRGAAPAGGCYIRPDEYTTLENLIDRSQSTVYTVHVGSSLSPALNNLAGAIGAENALLSFGDATGLERALSATATYYRAAFDADAKERAGPPQRIDLRVTRPGTRVRAPDVVSFAATSGGTAAGLLRSTRAHGDLPLRAAAFPSSHTGGKVKLVVLFEPADSSTKLTSAVAAVFDEHGEMAGQTTLRPADLAARPIVTALPVAAGSYRVRVAATDATGRGGTVDENVRAELPAVGSIRTSGLLFGTRLEAGFVPRLEFTVEQNGVAYLELYAPPQAPVSVVFELAGAPDGPARQTVPADMQRGTAGDMQIAVGQFDVQSLPAGDHFVRAVVSIDGQRAGTVARTLRKAAR